MSRLTTRLAARVEDWAFVHQAMPRLLAVDDEIDWDWLCSHVPAGTANVLVLEEGGELAGFIVYQALPSILWVTSLFTRTGVGERHDVDLVRLLSQVAEQYGLRRIGFRSIRPGWLRVMQDRFGLPVKTKSYTEYQVTLPLQESVDGRLTADDDDQSGPNPSPG